MPAHEITTAQAAALTGASRQAIHSAVKRGLIRARTVPGPHPYLLLNQADALRWNQTRRQSRND